MEKSEYLAKVLNSQIDPIERCELINRFHKHPDLTADDYKQILIDSDPLVQFVAAFFYVTRFQTQKPREVIPIFQKSLKNYDSLAKRFSKLSYDPIGMIWYLTRAFFFVEYYDRSAAYAALKSLLFGLESTALHDRGLNAFLEQVFALAFRDCELPFADDFLVLLERIAELRILEKYAGDHCVLRQFMNWGLPIRQAELEALLATLRSGDKPDSQLREYMHGPHDYPLEDDCDHATMQILKQVIESKK